MFGGIARRYDFLNHLLSLRRDVGWRKEAAREVPSEPGLRILDLCGGTGDLAVEIARPRPDSTVVCCDFCHEMLALASGKFARKGVAARCLALEADGLRLPFSGATFDVVTVAFGVRNFSDMHRGLLEILRVLRPGGRLVVLEFTQPHAPVLAGLYRAYLRTMLPILGDRISGREGPYRYLARTIGEFPDPQGLAGQIREAGFAAVGWRTLTGGIVAIHTAYKGSG